MVARRDRMERPRFSDPDRSTGDNASEIVKVALTDPARAAALGTVGRRLTRRALDAGGGLDHCPGHERP